MADVSTKEKLEYLGGIGFRMCYHPYQKVQDNEEEDWKTDLSFLNLLAESKKHAEKEKFAKITHMPEKNFFVMDDGLLTALYDLMKMIEGGGVMNNERQRQFIPYQGQQVSYRTVNKTIELRNKSKTDLQKHLKKGLQTMLHYSGAMGELFHYGVWPQNTNKGAIQHRHLFEDIFIVFEFGKGGEEIVQDVNQDTSAPQAALPNLQDRAAPSLTEQQRLEQHKILMKSVLAQYLSVAQTFALQSRVTHSIESLRETFDSILGEIKNTLVDGDIKEIKTSEPLKHALEKESEFATALTELEQLRSFATGLTDLEPDLQPLDMLKDQIKAFFGAVKERLEGDVRSVGKTLNDIAQSLDDQIKKKLPHGDIVGGISLKSAIGKEAEFKSTGEKLKQLCSALDGLATYDLRLQSLKTLKDRIQEAFYLVKGQTFRMCGDYAKAEEELLKVPNSSVYATKSMAQRTRLYFQLLNFSKALAIADEMPEGSEDHRERIECLRESWNALLCDRYAEYASDEALDRIVDFLKRYEKFVGGFHLYSSAYVEWLCQILTSGGMLGNALRVRDEKENAVGTAARLMNAIGKDPDAAIEDPRFLALFLEGHKLIELKGHNSLIQVGLRRGTLANNEIYHLEELLKKRSGSKKVPTALSILTGLQEARRRPSVRKECNELLNRTIPLSLYGEARRCCLSTSDGKAKETYIVSQWNQACFEGKSEEDAFIGLMSSIGRGGDKLVGVLKSLNRFKLDVECYVPDLKDENNPSYENSAKNTPKPLDASTAAKLTKTATALIKECQELAIPFSKKAEATLLVIKARLCILRGITSSPQGFAETANDVSTALGKRHNLFGAWAVRGHLNKDQCLGADLGSTLFLSRCAKAIECYKWAVLDFGKQRKTEADVKLFKEVLKGMIVLLAKLEELRPVYPYRKKIDAVAVGCLRFESTEGEKAFEAAKKDFRIAFHPQRNIYNKEVAEATKEMRKGIGSSLSEFSPSSYDDDDDL